MDYPVPTELTPLDEIPVERIVEADGFYFRSIVLKAAGTVIPQHSHSHRHATIVGHGCVRAWQNGQHIGDKSSGDVFVIAENSPHLFQALTDDTVLICCHNIESAMSLHRKGI